MAREFLVDQTVEEPLLERIFQALPARLVHTHRERAAWLDTQDWRLFHAGLVLERRWTNREAWLQLSDLGGAQVFRVPVGRQPVTVTTLPDGAVKDRISRLVGIRALLTRTTAEGPTSLLAVLDDQDKTVARVVVQGPLTVEGGKDGSKRVGVRARVAPLRGYAKAARRVERQLASTPGLMPADCSMFDEVTRARGLLPGFYRSKPDLAFVPGMPAAEAFAGAFGQLLEIVRGNLDGTIRQLDTEFLHDLRVAVRRSRSVLKTAHSVIDEDTREHYAQELKWLADATSTSRDLDVYLLNFDEMVPASDVQATEPFRSLLERRHKKAHTALNRVLRSQRCTTLLDGWEQDLTKPAYAGPAAESDIRDVSRALLAKAWNRVQKRGRAIGPDSPAEAVHDLRKRCKELRYLLEFFASLHEPSAHRQIVGELKRLQDNLGEFQDAESQRFLVMHCAEDLRTGHAPVETLLTMGRMEHRLQQRQAAAHDHFAGCWSRFGDRQNTRRFKAMVASS